VLSTVNHIAVNVPPRQHAFEIADQLSAAFAQTAVERDKRGGTAKTERDLLRASGLLNVTIPADLGGWGMEWPDTMKLVRVFARVDSSIAHLFGFQHLMLASVSLYGSWPQTEELFSETVRNKWFWGNALNPLDKRTSLTSKCGVGYLINGRKSFCSGALDSDMLIVSAIRSVDEKFMVAAIPSARQGFAFSMTGMPWASGKPTAARWSSATWPRRRKSSEDTRAAGQHQSVLRSCIAQLILSNIFLGIAEGALEESRNYTLAQTRPWITSTAKSATEDPYILANYGSFFVNLQAAQALTDIAGESLQRAWESGDAITENQRGKCALDVATSKVATNNVGLEITNRMFEVMGARAAAGPARIDRFWRNLRTHTLHDPVDYKIRELGDWALNRQLPKPSFYS
jgi:alkylation response protein AidB-like acyl-CoA dehydrogenase